MRILPVVDLKDGVVVRGVGGRRQEYRPIASALTSSCHPEEVAQAFLDRFGFTELYLADLDAIGGKAPALSIYTNLRSIGFRLWVDAGIQEPDMAAPLVQAGIDRIVAGLETLREPDVLNDLCRKWNAERMVFSLDLKNGTPLGNPAWEPSDSLSIARRAVDTGIQRVIVLDLARVGGGEGTGTEELCSQLATVHPDVEIIAGGGVRGIEDLRRLKKKGIRGVLLASALHDGILRRKDLEKL
jgi:phosphoribosylformimino-5-aminoimidazole carboxamide ribotide isomerase